MSRRAKIERKTKESDIVVELDGSAIEGVGDLQRRLVGDIIGRRIELRIERSGESRSISVTPVELTA